MNRRNTLIAGLAGISAVAATTSSAVAEDPQAENPALEVIRAVLKAHDAAMTSHDMEGVLATLSPHAVIMGSGPGEIWSGTEEIKEAYRRFFEGYDKGQQDFHYNFKFGGLSSEMGWLAVSGEIKAKKDGKPVDFPINISVTMAKKDGAWLIAAMHFSTLSSGADTKAGE